MCVSRKRDQTAWKGKTLHHLFSPIIVEFDINKLNSINLSKVDISGLHSTVHSQPLYSRAEQSIHYHCFCSPKVKFSYPTCTPDTDSQLLLLSHTSLFSVYIS